VLNASVVRGPHESSCPQSTKPNVWLLGALGETRLFSI
jgi:hypothetical protein